MFWSSLATWPAAVRQFLILSSFWNGAHVMPSYIQSPFDQTDQFQNALTVLAERFPDFAGSICAFDNVEAIEVTERRQLAAMARIDAGR